MSALLDWDLARRVATASAGEGPAAMAGGTDLVASSARARSAVLAYTELDLREDLPDAEWVSRRDWALVNLESMHELLAPLEERVAETLPDGLAGQATAAVSGRALALQVGGLLGLASRRVLGQYEFPLGGDRAPRLLFVGANLDAASGELGASPPDVLDWVALHETTHAAHLGAAPWLREHLRGLAGRLLAEAPLESSPSELLSRLRQSLPRDPRRLIAELRASDPITLLAPGGARETVAAVAATMAAIEGFAEHVMDAAAPDGLDVAALRIALDRRRESRGSVARLLGWLLGLETKLRQYRDGKRFVDDIVGRAGIGTLNRAWHGPETLPRADELVTPELWLERIAAASVA